MEQAPKTISAADTSERGPLGSSVAPGYVPAGDSFYLSFGGGVNSTALYLHLLELGQEFEAVYVDHGTDYPETAEYVAYFAARYPVC